MRRIEFCEMLDDMLLNIRELEKKKGDIYAEDSDRLVQFKDMAFLAGVRPERALMVLWAKHILTIRYIIDRLDSGDVHPSRELITEVTGDAAFYPMLLRGLMLETYVRPQCRNRDSG